MRAIHEIAREITILSSIGYKQITYLCGDIQSNVFQ